MKRRPRHARLITRFAPGLLVGVLAAACSSAGGDDPKNAGQSSGSAGSGDDGALPPCPTCVILPIEVLGPDGTTRDASFKLDGSPELAKKLFLQIHGLGYQDKASVQVNDGDWVSLNNTSVAVAEPGRRYGGIGGGFASLKMTLDLAPGSIKAGENTIRFRFNHTDGRSMGFRVLAFNLLDDAGQKLLSEEATFRDEDPDAWTPPKDTPADIAAGEALWKTAELTESPLSDAKLLARCSDCHAVDGRDLEYFNYSNLSIIERAKFHGLTEEQGEQIASYIRSHLGPNPGRPWNPPYQPGPGLEQKPVEEWAAGAGLSAALDKDSDTQAHLPGEGESRDALIGPGARLLQVNKREIPIALQLLDWNHWLPDIHPKDALGEQAFEALENVKLYREIRAGLEGQGELTKEQFIAEPMRQKLDDWANSMTYTYDDRIGLYDALMPGQSVSELDFRRSYAGAVWNAVKQWEIMQEFGLEGLGRSFYGMNGETRSWFSNRHVFDASPHIMNQLRPQEGMMSKYRSHGDCEPDLINAYLANAWYELQNLLNSGNRQAERGGHHTIDWGYQSGLFGDLERASGYTEPMRLAAFTLKSMEQHDSGIGPEDSWWGWTLRNNVAGSLRLGSDWSEQPDPKALVQTTFQVWLEKNGSFTEERWKTTLGTSVDGSNVPPSDWVLGGGTPEENDRSVADGIARDLEDLRDKFDVDSAILSALADFGAMMWPNNDWNAFKRPVTDPAPAPSGVGAESGVEKVTVSWAAVPGATSYNVKRATSPDGAFLPVALFVADTSFTDHGLDGGRTYYYKVSANVGKDETDASQAVSAEATQGLVVRYTFDDPDGDAVADAAGLNHAGLFGGAGREAGKLGKALALDGKKAFAGVSLPLSRWLGKSATLSAWVKTTATSDEIYFKRPGIAGVAGGGGDECYWGVLNGEGKIGIGMGGGDDTHVWSNSPINDGAWHHVAFTRDADTGAVAIYIDGVKSASGTSTAGVFVKRFFSIGRTDTINNYFPGSLDDMRIYNHVLSDAEVAALADEI